MTGSSPEVMLEQRRRQALRNCGRVLSQIRRPNLRERLALLLAEAEVVHDLEQPLDAYGDGLVQELEHRVANLLGKPAALFFPTGTMAQQVALRIWAQRSGCRNVALHPLAHPERREQGAISVLGGLHSLPLTMQPRPPCAADVRAVNEPFGSLMLELPLRDAGFMLPAWDDLCATVSVARERNAKVHFDGARLWECTPHFGRSLAQIADLADSVYVSFYKSLEGLSGAALAGPEDFIDEARTWRHRYGGMLFQQFPAVLAALAGLKCKLPELPGFVAHAAMVAATFRGVLDTAVPWSQVHPQVPHTHQFQLWLPWPASSLEEAGLQQAEQTGTALFGKWHEPGPPGVAMTELTIADSAMHWDTNAVASALTDFLARLPAPSRPSM